MALTADKFIVPNGPPSGGDQRMKSTAWGEDGSGFLNNGVISLPKADGTTGFVVTTDGAGNLTLNETEVETGASITGDGTAGSPLEVLKTVLEVSINTTVSSSDRNIDVTTGATNKTITLPLIASSNGRQITIFKADSGAGDVIVDGNGSETINGALTNSITSQYESKTYIGVGSEWRVK